MIFQNRKQAGQQLAQHLIKYKGQASIVLALPRGGVPVAAEIAQILEVPLNVLAVRKIGAPHQSELAVGALCENDEPLFNQLMLSRLDLQPEDLKSTVQAETKKIQKQIAAFRQGNPLPRLQGQTVIVVDDGLATGATMTAAVRHLKKIGAHPIIVAIPVAAALSAQSLRREGIELVAIDERSDLSSVGEWYDDFSQVSDEEVRSLLKINQQQKSKDLSLTFESATIKSDRVILPGDLALPLHMKALILFAHGSGSSRKSPRNIQVAQTLNAAGFGTLLFDLLTQSETLDRRNVFDIDFLSQRLIAATDWVINQPRFKNVKIGYFGASTGAAAAIKAADALSEKEKIYSIVSRGGRPDLAGNSLRKVKVPTLLIVGSDDRGVVELNQDAQKKLFHSRISLVPGATHLFEEPGALEAVETLAADWFEMSLQERGWPQSQKPLATLNEVLADSIVKINQESDLSVLLEKIKDKRVVMLGESSHGTQEYYFFRRLISRHLIQDHGFKFIAVEGDWPDAHRLHRYIKTGEGKNAREVLLRNHRWPTWMWANHEIAKLAEELKGTSAGFYGLDLYSLFESIDEITTYLKKNHPALAKEVGERYACFEPFEKDEMMYAKSLLSYPVGCEQEVIENLRKMLELRLSTASNDMKKNGDDLFSAQQNAQTVADAESYYRAMFAGDASSWNVRDTHMMDTLDRLLERHGESAKAIVWAHNTHVGDYRATDMRTAGYVNIGGLARQRYGEDNVALVGFGSHRGEVLAGSSWGAPEQTMTLPPAAPGSYEHHFHLASQQHQTLRFYLDLTVHPHGPLAQTLGHRAVGVVYNPEHEYRSNYVPTELSHRYDHFLFIDKTTALRSLHAPSVHGEFPETWPSGV